MKHAIKLNLCLFIIFTLIISFSSMTFANSNLVNSPGAISTALSSDISASIDLADSDCVISDPMTYEEMASVIASDENISLKEAKKLLGKPQAEPSNAIMASGTYIYSYQTLSKTVTVSNDYLNDYKVVMKFYCYTCISDYGMSIITILNVGMNRQYYSYRAILGNLYIVSVTKQFNGSIYTNLENSRTIFFIINGDFYNNGTTTYSGGVSIPVGGNATVQFGVSYASNWYRYCYQELRLVTAGG